MQYLWILPTEIMIIERDPLTANRYFNEILYIVSAVFTAENIFFMDKVRPQREIQVSED